MTHTLSTASEQPRLLSVSAAAAQLGISERLAWRLVLRAQLKEKGQRTIEVAHMKLRQALDQAVMLHLATRNVAALVPPPKQDRREQTMHTWTEEEARAFLEVADLHGTYGPIWRVSLATGMRRGELLGLRWANVNWQQIHLHVAQSITMIGGKLLMGPPKTPHSIRQVTVTTDLMEALREYRALQNERRLALGPAWADHDLVFASSVGTPINPINLQRAYYHLIALAGVPHIRIHDQRHTHASWAIKDGIDPKTVSERLGHKDVSTTLARYTHIDAETHRKAGETMGQKVSRRKQPPRPLRRTDDGGL